MPLLSLTRHLKNVTVKRQSRIIHFIKFLSIPWENQVEFINNQKKVETWTFTRKIHLEKLYQKRIPSVFRNNERKSGSAKWSFKHVALKVSDAKQFPNSDLIFWFVFYQEKMNKRNPSKVKLSLVSQNLKQKFTIDQAIQEKGLHIMNEMTNQLARIEWSSAKTKKQWYD